MRGVGAHWAIARSTQESSAACKTHGRRVRGESIAMISICGCVASIRTNDRRSSSASLPSRVG